MRPRGARAHRQTQQGEGEQTREPLSRLRRTVVRNMTQSWTEIPHAHLYHHADITAMEELRQRYRDRARAAGGNLTISVMLLKVVAAALKAHPRLNASLDTETNELILKKYVHLGVAVDTERGLVVPKIEHVDQKNIIDLSVELNEIANRARENQLTIDEQRGASFTVTTLGSLAIVSTIAFGGREVASGQITPGQLVAFMVYLQLLQQPVRQIGMIVNSAARGSISGKRVFDVIDLEPAIRDRVREFTQLRFPQPR